MPKRVLQGVVVSDQERQDGGGPRRAPLHASFAAKDRAAVQELSRHDEKNEFKVGEMVWIEECPPISKQKRWTVAAARAATS